MMKRNQKVKYIQSSSYIELQDSTIYVEIFAVCNFHGQATDQDFRV